jgi:hypothetical protein
VKNIFNMQLAVNAKATLLKKALSVSQLEDTLLPSEPWFLSLQP